MKKLRLIEGEQPATKSVGIWIRVSTEDQARGESPEHHERRARAYAESKAWRVREVYHLEAVSGKSVLGHPEAKRMLEHVASGHITGLIFSKLARLARNTRELLDFADIFREHEADLISLQESIDTTTPAGRLFYTMIAAMAQWEREEIAERVAASVPIRAKLGKPTGGAAPFGYRWENRQLVVDSQEAPVRKLLFELFLDHRRKKAVARILNERGYRTRGGGKFSDTTVDRLIRDPVAKGVRRANYTRSLGKGKQWELKPKDEWVLTSVEPLVSEGVWRECNAILDAQREKMKRPAKRPVHLFAGVVRCACGEKMYVLTESGKYICRKCRNKIAGADLEAVFQEQLRSFFVSPEDVARAVGQADEEIKAKEERLGSLEAERGKVQAEMDKVYRAYVGDEIPMDAFGRQYRPLEARIKALEEELPRLQGEVDFLKVRFLARDEVLAESKDLYDRWPSLSLEEKRGIVEAVVEGIQVGKEEVEIDLSYFRGSPEVAGNRQHNFTVALPFSRLRLTGPRPAAMPRGYPREVRTLGDHIRKRRLDLGLWQRTLADQLGIREETLATWERGQARPLPRHYGAIVRFLGYDPEASSDSLPGRLRAVRLRLGLTQEQFASRAGLDEGSVCRWESGSRQPCRWMVDRVKAILKRLEGEMADCTGIEGSDGRRPDLTRSLSFFDLTRWRRTPPSGLLPEKVATLGDQIRRRRLELGLSQAEAGKLIGVGRATVYRWERNEVAPPTRLLSDIYTFLFSRSPDQSQ